MKDGEALKFIYHCYGGTHSSVTAAAIHLGWLPADRTPTAKQLMEIPHFDTKNASEQGELTLFGKDKHNNQVYIVGRRNQPHLLITLIEELTVAFNVPKNSFCLINAMPSVNLTMRIGGVLSRKCKLVKLGRPIVTKGTLKAIPCIQKLVAKVKNDWESNK